MMSLPKKAIASIIAAAVVIAGGAAVASKTVLPAGRYNTASGQLEAGRYAEALENFEALGDYRDAAVLAEECRKAQAYEEGVKLFEKEKYEEALNSFKSADDYEDSKEYAEKCRVELVTQEIDEAVANEEYGKAIRLLDSADGKLLPDNASRRAEYKKKEDYQKADKAYNDGLYYTAYKAFNELEGYSDSDKRAEECIQPLPENSELFHDPDYESKEVSLQIKAPKANKYYAQYTYFKIYSTSGGKEELVSCSFLHPGKSVTVKIPAGDYILKEATGIVPDVDKIDAVLDKFGEGNRIPSEKEIEQYVELLSVVAQSADWFGEKEMFGEDGTYVKLVNTDDSNIFTLDKGAYTLTLQASNGNVGQDDEKMSSF